VRNAFLVGEKVYLRGLERGDAAIFLPWVNDFEIIRNLVMHRPMSLEAEEAFIARVNEDKNVVVFAIVLKTNDRVIGNTALHAIHPRNQQAGFGIMIGDKQEWNKGHGTEATRLILRYAFDTLNLHRIWLHVYEDNQRAIRSYEKVGFRLEGKLREHVYRDGRFWDVLTMGILRKEWREISRAFEEPRNVVER
jgi:RimJ/RimL family protein N-acetyltransferase